MRKNVIVYGKVENSVQKKAVEILSRILHDYSFEYPVCCKYDETLTFDNPRLFYIGTAENNPYTARGFDFELTDPEGYAIKVQNDCVYIQGYDDIGVVYGCIDFYNKYILKYEFPDDAQVFRVNLFENELADFEYTSCPSVKNRGIWTWGHVIYDYRGFFDNMLMLKMNTVIIWNDFAPINAKEMLDYAHSCGIKVIWGYPWLWDTDCSVALKDGLRYNPRDFLEKYEKEYGDAGGDGIYVQSFTELNVDSVNGIVIADAVADFVNETSELFFEKYPDIELQFGLHATSVKDRLECIEKVNPKIRIVWEDCGAFPFSYLPSDLEEFENTKEFAEKIAVLRGENDRFGVVTKGFTKLDWTKFEHPEGAALIGAASDYVKENRIIRKSRIWKYLQAHWLVNADKAYEMIQQMCKKKQGDLYITALVEDGMFEENLMYPVALYSEMLWDTDADLKRMISEVAMRDYVTFA